MDPNKKIRVAHVVCVLPPYGGGLGSAAHEEANALVERGYDVTVFTPSFKESDKIERKYKVIGLWPFFKLGLGSMLPQLFWRLWKFDIVHLHFPFFGAAFFVGFLKKIRGRKLKLIVTYHQDLILSGWRNLYYKLTCSLVLPRVLHFADQIIVSSFDYIENSNIQNYYFNNLNKFEELPFAAEARFYPEKRDETLLSKIGFIASDFIVLFVGGLNSAHYFKGVNFLIKAISLIEEKRIKALIVGSGNLRHQYEEQAKALGLTDRVKFAGYVANVLLPKYYNLADVFVLPSINKNEAFGIVLVEAMACGKPLIASNLKGVRGVVEPGINGILVEPKNSYDIAEKIKMLFANPAMMKKFSESGLVKMENKYSLETVNKRLIEIYQKVLGEKIVWQKQ